MIVYKWQNTSNDMVKDLITNAIDKKLGYFCDKQHFKIITMIDSIILITGHTRLLGVLYKF